MTLTQMVVDTSRSKTDSLDSFYYALTDPSVYTLINI